MYKFRDLDERVQRDPRKYLRCSPQSPEKTTNPLEFLYFFDYKLNGQMIGSSEVFVDLNLKDVVWSSFFPLTFLSGARKKGLGTLTHVITLEELELTARKDLGVDVRDFSVGHFSDIEKPRLRQLGKMGIRWDRMIPYDEYFRKSRDYAEKIGVL